MFIEPMMAASLPEKKRPDITYENGYILEAKHDGMRAIISKVNGKIEVYSRVGKTYAQHLPKIVEQFDKLPDNTILDGELMVKTGTKMFGENVVPVPDFNQTMRIMGSGWEKAVDRQEEHTVTFYVFDVLQFDNLDHTDMAYETRTSALRDIARHYNLEDVEVAPAWGEWDEDTLLDLLKEGIEGAILKNKDSTYLSGKRRANTWYKVKAELTADVVVMGFTEAKEGKTGKFSGLIGAIRFGAYNDAGELVEVGQCSGMTDEMRTGWTAVRDFMPEGVIPVNPKNGTQYVIEIKYNDLLATGTPRHPQYRTERFDKRPEDCLMTQFTEV